MEKCVILGLKKNELDPSTKNKLVIGVDDSFLDSTYIDFVASVINSYDASEISDSQRELYTNLKGVIQTRDEEYRFSLYNREKDISKIVGFYDEIKLSAGKFFYEGEQEVLGENKKFSTLEMYLDSNHEGGLKHDL